MQSRRDELLDDLHNGRIDPVEAERLAAAEGIEPLCPIPDPALFDPAIEPWWTMPMVIAWIVWRTNDRVRGQFAPFRSANPYWCFREMRVPGTEGTSSVEQAGWFLEEQREASAMTLALIEALGLDQDDCEPTKATVREAREALWRWAAGGHTHTVAVRISDGEVVTIPCHEWSDLELHQNRGRDELCFGHDVVPRYRAIRFRTHDVIRHWPVTEASWNAKRDAQRRCEDWLRQLMLESLDRPTCTFEEARLAAKTDYGIGRDPFRALWKKVVADTGAYAWAHGGRRPQNPAIKSLRKK